MRRHRNVVIGVVLLIVILIIAACLAQIVNDIPTTTQQPLPKSPPNISPLSTRIPEGSITLAGMIYFDLNNDGLRQRFEPSISGLRTQVTDQEGKVIDTFGSIWQVNDLSEGEYTLAVDRTSIPEYLVLGTQTSDSYTLASGTTSNPVDIGLQLNPRFECSQLMDTPVHSRPNNPQHYPIPGGRVDAGNGDDVVYGLHKDQEAEIYVQCFHSEDGSSQVTTTYLLLKNEIQAEDLAEFKEHTDPHNWFIVVNPEMYNVGWQPGYQLLASNGIETQPSTANIIATPTTVITVPLQGTGIAAGVVSYDIDGDGIHDIGEPIIQNSQVSTPRGIVYVGKYNWWISGIPTGIQAFTVIAYPQHLVATNSTQQVVTFANQQQIDNINFKFKLDPALDCTRLNQLASPGWIWRGRQAHPVPGGDRILGDGTDYNWMIVWNEHFDIWIQCFVPQGGDTGTQTTYLHLKYHPGDPFLNQIADPANLEGWFLVIHPDQYTKEWDWGHVLLARNKEVNFIVPKDTQK